MVTVIILVNLQVPLQKKEGPQILFSQVPHPCQQASYLRMLTPLQIEEHEKYLFLPLYGNTEDSLMTAHTPMINESQ